MDYTELRRVYRLEKNSSQLVKLEPGFYPDLKALLREQRSSYLSNIKNGNLSKAKNYSELTKLVREILQLREKKILHKALVVSRSGEFSDSNLTKEEKKTFSGILEVLRSHKSEINGLLGESEKPESRKKSERKDSQSVKVSISKEVPAFVSADMKEYGPFSEGQEVELPKKTAELLVSRKLAEFK